MSPQYRWSTMIDVLSWRILEPASATVGRVGRTTGIPVPDHYRHPVGRGAPH